MNESVLEYDKGNMNY